MGGCGMGKMRSFHAVIQSAGGGGAFVEVPFDVESEYRRKRVPIKATIEGLPYRGTLVRMGGPRHMLLVLKEIRERAGKTFGDEVTVSLEEDREERRVAVPADFKQALSGAPPVKEIFENLSYTHQREYVKWIEEAKRDETRSARIEKTMMMLAEGKKSR